MPGVRPLGFRFGDRAELLAEFALSSIAFVVRVPRQEDVGHDLLCTLAQREGTLLRAGPSFSVQVKNKREDVIYEKEHEVQWIKGLESPFFLCIADCDALFVDIYSTWNRLTARPFWTPNRVVLAPGGLGDEYRQATDNDGTLRIPLGKPILRISSQDTMDEERTQILSSVMRWWVLVDRLNIVNMNAGMHWVLGPTSYSTNELLAGEDIVIYFFSPPVVRTALQKRIETNFCRAATAWRIAMHRTLETKSQESLKTADRIADLEQVLRSHSDSLGPLEKRALRELGGLDLGE